MQDWERTNVDTAELMELASAAAALTTDLARIHAILMDSSFIRRCHAVALDLSDHLQVDYAGVNLVVRDQQILLAGVDRRNPESTFPVIEDIRYSFCQYVAAGNTPVKIDNAANDPLVMLSPGFTEHGVASYAGVPLHRPTPIGAICVANYRPHVWTADELAYVTEISKSLQQQ